MCSHGCTAAFLRDNDLSQHVELFQKSGVDDFGTLLSFTEEHFEEIGLPIWNSVKLMNLFQKIIKTAADKEAPVFPGTAEQCVTASSKTVSKSVHSCI